MARKHFSTEQIIRMLCKAEVLLPVQSDKWFSNRSPVQRRKAPKAGNAATIALVQSP
jgi:hypothetical protein